MRSAAAYNTDMVNLKHIVLKILNDSGKILKIPKEVLVTILKMFNFCGISFIV